MLILEMDDEFTIGKSCSLQVYKDSESLTIAIWDRNAPGKAMKVKITPEVALTFAESLVSLLMKEDYNENGN